MPLLAAQCLFSQTALPVIKASSKKVSINDGGYLQKDSWFLSPAARPDVFTADRSRQAKWVLFYTDIDSIKVKVTPGSRFNFIVLLNGKDSCYTQIASAIPPTDKILAGTDRSDTIPFTLTLYNAIQVKAISNDTDTLNLHFDLGSFDFRIMRALLTKIKKPLKIQMGPLTWINPEPGATTLTAHDMDGRFGWNLFEGKIVEINYDRQLLIIHSKLPGLAKGYSALALSFIHSYLCIKASFAQGGTTYSGDFLLDTGSDAAMIADSSWTALHQFTSGLPVIRTKILHDPRGVSYETKTVLAPQMRIHNFTLTNIPAMVLPGPNPTGFSINFLGNDLLKRFNMVLDFRKDMVYLKPNLLFNTPYREQ